MVVAESLVDGCKSPLRGLDAGLEVVVPVGEDFRLHNGAETVHLADAGIPCQDVGILLHCQLRGPPVADFQDATPLGKARTSFVVLLAVLSKSVEALSGRLIVRAQQLHNSLIHLDAWNDALVPKELHEASTIISFLEERLVEKNYSTEVFCNFLQRQRLNCSSIIIRYANTFTILYYYPCFYKPCRQ